MICLASVVAWGALWWIAGGLCEREGEAVSRFLRVLSAAAGAAKGVATGLWDKLKRKAPSE